MNAKKAKGKARYAHPTLSSNSVHQNDESLTLTRPLAIEILNLRKAIWSHVPARDHSPKQIYTHGEDQMDLMVHGDVSYGHHAGHQTSTEWAASMNLVKEGGKVKVSRYHIIVDSAAHV